MSAKVLSPPCLRFHTVPQKLHLDSRNYVQKCYATTVATVLHTICLWVVKPTVGTVETATSPRRVITYNAKIYIYSLKLKATAQYGYSLRDRRTNFSFWVKCTTFHEHPVDDVLFSPSHWLNTRTVKKQQMWENGLN